MNCYIPFNFPSPWPLPRFLDIQNENQMRLKEIVLLISRKNNCCLHSIETKNLITNTDSLPKDLNFLVKEAQSRTSH